MPSKKSKRKSVSIRNTSYARLHDAVEAIKADPELSARFTSEVGVSMASVVETLLEEGLGAIGVPEVSKREAEIRYPPYAKRVDHSYFDSDIQQQVSL